MGFKKCFFTVGLLSALPVLLFGQSGSLFGQSAPLRLWYDKPAVKWTEALIALNLRTAKRGDYARPLRKQYDGALASYSPLA